MKILKIELQNINSLKSETPIVIDFEDSAFLDTNLFAITGKTGSGKSTILDAITIALYGKVARLNKTSIYEVVSKGSIAGYTRVTFENEGIIYSAFRSMSILTKTFKVRKKPVDEYELSIQSGERKGEIVASSKTEMTNEIKNIVKLSFEQFCKSVLIAQGDFASFLNASEVKKGELLQEITGEDIYKQIGYEVQNRVSAEKIKLEKLKAKVNTDHLLSDHDKKKLEERVLLLPALELELNQKIKKTTEKVAVFEEQKEMKSEEEVLETSFEAFKEKKENNQTLLVQLSEVEKLAPVFQKINLLERSENQHQEKKLRSSELSKSITLAQGNLQKYNALFKESFQDLEETKLDVEKWKPIYQKAEKIENEIEAENKSLQKSKLSFEKKKAQVEIKEKELQTLSESITALEKRVSIGEEYVLENEKYKELEHHFEEWSVISLDWKNAIDQKIKNSEKLKTAAETLEDVSLKLEEKSNLQLQEKKQFESLENQADRYEEVEKDILEELEVLDVQKSNKNALENALKVAQSYERLKKEILDTEKVIEECLEQKTLVTNDILKVSEGKKIAKQSLDDQFKILSLQKEILSFEKEREKLVEGEACKLCGSKEHPFVEEYKDISLIQTEESELVKREKELAEITKEEQGLILEETRLIESIKNKESDLIKLKENLAENEISFETLQLDFSINASSGMNDDLEIILQSIKTKTQKIEDLKIEKEAISKSVKEAKSLQEKLQLNALEISKLSEQKNHLNQSTEILEVEIKSLSETIEKSKTKIKVQLEKYNYEINEYSDWVLTFNDFKTKCKNYLDALEKLKKLKSEVESYQVLEKEKQTVLVTDQNECIKIEEELNGIFLKIDELKKNRGKILSWEINLQEENKRFEDLLQLKTIQKEKSEKEKVAEEKELKGLEAKQEITQKDINVLTSEINELELSINEWLKSSDFENISEIKSKAISEEELKDLRAIKDEITREEIQLKERQRAFDEKRTIISNKLADIHEKEDDLVLQLEDDKKMLASILEEKGEAKATLEKDQLLRNDQTELVEKIGVQEVEYLRWSRLKSALGGTNDSFNKFAQHLTLKNLLILANRHLSKMNKRYTLNLKPIEFGANAIPKSFLTFEMIDHHLADMHRSVDTASGGEKFMISLSLALGLSDLSSKNVQIDSLFIDEGFGTLDETTLEDVIYALNTLQTDGKMIGVISHVKTLNERLGTQINVTKHSGGISTVNIT
ncbi:SbcC/MukB-like Walker B domain-containing protein [Flammeovirga aprica]|uniref:AAA family ATPase n=1 Tax=Flammeovirga aprica JL-4 TaxID=694437 RepID=A0A7X9RTK8_9BACT|nr:SbcC/MukB-like Walker B domain-containing protein [Flammeovirga aprica]NME68625.1 AAA family ATPase [Flammeovirga aprica JL-4]